MWGQGIFGNDYALGQGVPSISEQLLVAPQSPAGAGQSSWHSGMLDGFLSSTNDKGITTQGWGAPALAAGQGLFNAWMGMKQYGLYKDQLNESKRQFGLNYDAQRRTTNAALEDRQRARLASNPNAYQSLGSYMAANGIQGG